MHRRRGDLKEFLEVALCRKATAIAVAWSRRNITDHTARRPQDWPVDYGRPLADLAAQGQCPSAMSPIQCAITRCELPPSVLLRKYVYEGAYTDCYVTQITTSVSLPEYVEAFYTTAVFKLERLI